MLSLSLKCTFVFLLCEILRIKHINKVAKRFQMLLISNILYLSKGFKAELRSNSIVFWLNLLFNSCNQKSVEGSLAIDRILIRVAVGMSNLASPIYVLKNSPPGIREALTKFVMVSGKLAIKPTTIFVIMSDKLSHISSTLSCLIRYWRLKLLFI